MKQILIVEDEVAIAKVLQLKLKDSGFSVDLAGNGTEGLQMVSAKQYDLLLVDLLMPEVDGWEFLAQVKDLPCIKIVTSNLGQEEDIQKAVSLGVSNFLIKSNVSLTAIVDTVVAVLGSNA